MTNTSNRIPELAGTDIGAMTTWFVQLQTIGIDYHIDDNPKEIVFEGFGRLTKSELKRLTDGMETLFSTHSQDEVWNAWFPTPFEGFHDEDFLNDNLPMTRCIFCSLPVNEQNEIVASLRSQSTEK